MTKKKREISFLTPLVILGVTWAIKKSAEKSQDRLSKNRPADKPKPSHEDLAWKVGLAVVLTSTEALISRLMSKKSETASEESVAKTD